MTTHPALHCAAPTDVQNDLDQLDGVFFGERQLELVFVPRL
jgi:hypothetical protein